MGGGRYPKGTRGVSETKRKNLQDGDVGADPDIVANRDGSAGAQLGRPSPFQADWVCWEGKDVLIRALLLVQSTSPFGRICSSARQKVLQP